MKVNTLLSMALGVVYLCSFLIIGCKPKSTPKGEVAADSSKLKLSLAQWSIHRALRSGALRAEDFASIAKNDFGIDAIEYVNSFYKNHASDSAFWQIMRAKADSLKVTSLLIMVDEEGDLGNPKVEERKKAVENHYKWVDDARILGCHSIRVNAFGEGTKAEVQQAIVDALKQLCAYAAKSNVNVLIENHGLYSSDGKWIAEIIQQVNMPNCGTLPDFGNWCISAKWGSTQAGSNCKQQHDRYTGVADMLPFARGVSAKAYSFNKQGEETIIDYDKMLKLVADAKFTGYVGIEYEGDLLTEREGILATKGLLEKSWKKIK